MTIQQLHLPFAAACTDSSAESTDSWYTPAEFIHAARAVLGSIDLDPASTPEANRVVQAARFFTLADDGLSRPWQGRAWCNPPYSRPGPWIEKAIAHYRRGEVSAAILLLPSATDTRWFQPLWNYPICFKAGRIKFWGRPGSGGPTGSVFVYLGHDVARFRAVFGAYGHITGGGA